jgi:hypothetical protein
MIMSEVEGEEAVVISDTLVVVIVRVGRIR